MKMHYTSDYNIIKKWLFISSIIMESSLCIANYSFERGFGYFPFSPLKLNLNENENLFISSVSENNKILLVLDASETMYSQNRIYKLKHALHHWIHSVPEDMMLGLAQFNDYAHPLINISSVTESLKEEILNAIPIIAEGGCCIGCAVKCALEMFGVDEKGGTIILITDGRNTVPGEDVKDVLSLISNTNIKINTISLGDAADDLEHLAWTTGGRTYSVLDQQGLVMLSGALFDSLNSILGKKLQITNIFEAEISNKDNKIHSDFVIDLPLVSLNIYYGPEKFIDQLELNSSETHVTSKDFEKWDKNNRYFAQTLKEGLWTISLTYSFLNKYAAVVVDTGLLMSESNTNSKINIMCWHSAEAGPVNTNLKPVAVYVTIFKAAHFIFDVNVSALLYAPNGTTTKIDLWDNGSGADSVKNDGTYSSFLPITSMTGRYSLKFQAVGKYRSTTAGSEKNSSGIKSFSRICRTTSFKVISAANIYPPSKIHDLKIVENNNTFVNICWTAPGKYLDWGKVDKYITRYMRMESCPHMLQTNLSVWTAEAVAPILTNESGKPECLALNYTQYLSLTTCLCISVYGTVNVGLSGLPSNVVEIYCPTINDTTKNSSAEEASFLHTTDTCCMEGSNATTVSGTPVSSIVSEPVSEQPLSNKSRNEIGIKIQETSNFPFVPLIIAVVILFFFAGLLLILMKWKKLRNVCVFHSYNVYRAKYNERKSQLVTYTSVNSVAPEVTD